jgi:putative NADH-flavin reductase
MATITVLGGTGYTGTSVVRAAAARGHAVTSVSRSRPAEKADGVTYVHGSVTTADPASLVTAADVVVGALSPNSGELAGKLGGIYQSLAPAVAAMGARLVIIGGFSALRRVAGGPRIAFSEDVNPLFAVAAREVAAIADWLLTTPAELAWTYISPASAYGVRNPGAALGRYRLGGDVALTDAEGRSDVSGADFATAVVDVIDRREHYRAHISVAY